jgi:AhpD family alkylhydroperoxidase
MPRLASVNPATDTGRGAEILNGPLKEKQINIFKGIATNPGVLEAFLGFAGGVKAGSLTPAEHEVIALVCAEKRHCQYCLAAHTKVASGVGIDDDLSIRIRKGDVEDGKQQSLIDFTQAVLDTHGFVTDPQLADFRAAGYDDAAAIEVIGAIAVNTFTNYFNHLNDTAVDFPVPATV